MRYVLYLALLVAGVLSMYAVARWAFYADYRPLEEIWAERQMLADCIPCPEPDCSTWPLPGDCDS